MKKVIIAFMLAACMAFSVFAQEESKSEKKIWDHGDNVSELSYQSVPVFKILDQADAYIIYYEKQGLDIGQIAVPKAWFKNGLDRKLDFRTKPAGMGSYMTVLYKGGDLYKILLTVNPSRLDPVWGVAPNGTKTEVSADTQTIDIKF